MSSREGEGRDGEEYTRLEAEKAALTLNLASLQEEKDRQREQLDRLRNMLVFNGSDAAASSDGAGDIDRKRAKRARETWCPGATLSNHPPPCLALVLTALLLLSQV